jgi:hypothetical protein
MLPQMTLLLLQEDQIVILPKEMLIIQRALLTRLTSMFRLFDRRHIRVIDILSKSSRQNSIRQQSLIPFKTDKSGVTLRSKGSRSFVKPSKPIEIHRQTLGIMHHKVKEVLGVPGG